MTSDYQLWIKSTHSSPRYYNKLTKCTTIKRAIITQIWHRTKSSLTIAWHLIIVPNMNKITTFFSEMSQHSKLLNKMAMITQIWHRAKFPWNWIMIPNMKKFHPATMEKYMKMDGQTDWNYSYISNSARRCNTNSASC